MSTHTRTLHSGRRDDLIREEPLLISVGEHQLLTMRTPGDDEHLALGFLRSEGVIDDLAQVSSCHFQPGDPQAQRPDRVDIDLRNVDASRLRGRLTRTHELRSSCGLCGLTDAGALLDELEPCLPGVPRVTRATLQTLREDFERRQVLFARTGACHGAALYGEDLALLGFGEDVGRHNALDKAIGRALRSGAKFTRAIALLSGRAGYDLVLKCLRLRIPVLASVSAPSALGFDLCHAAGSTLVGFLRRDRLEVYTDAGRLADP